MKESAPRREPLRSRALPLNVALFEGELTPALAARLTGSPLADIEQTIRAWMNAGALTRPRSRGQHPRVNHAVRTAALANATPHQRRRAYAELARALDDPDASGVERTAIARLYRAGGDQRSAIARYLSVAEGLLERGDRAGAGAVLAEAADADAGRTPELLAVFDLQARCALAQGDLTLARAVLERLRSAAAACGDRFATVRALLRGAEAALLDATPNRAAAMALRAAELAGSTGAGAAESATAALIATEALLDLERLPQARTRLAEAVALGVESNPAFTARYRFVCGRLQTEAGDPAAALEHFAQAAAAADDLEPLLAVRVEAAIGRAQLENGDVFGAASTLRAAGRWAKHAQLPVLAGELAVALAGVLFEAGRYTEARHVLLAAAPAASAPLSLRIALALDDGPLIERWANAQIADCVEDALAARSPRRIAATVPVLAEVERRRGAAGAAQGLFHCAIDAVSEAEPTACAELWSAAAEGCAPADVERIGAALERADPEAAPFAALLIELARLALAARQDADPRGLRERAERLAGRLFAAGFKTRARQAEAIAAKAQPSDRAGAVVALIAAGRSNGEIAAQLYLSKRTIEKTISAMLRLHGVRSRWQLIDSARDASANGDIPRSPGARSR